MENRRPSHSHADDQGTSESESEVRLVEADNGGQSIAVVGMACRFADADDTASLFQVITTGRRAFRRIPPGRIDLADYYRPDPAVPDATYSTRAAVLEGWRFDRAAFGVSQASYASADPAVWLALETAARAVAAAGHPSGASLPLERTGAFVGNSQAGDVSRAPALRLRWPYARQVLVTALATAGAPQGLADKVLAAAADAYRAPLPQVGAETLAGGMPGAIAAAVCDQLGLRGGGFAVDAGDASSLVAVASACSALAHGELDAAVAGGVDLSLDPLDLVGLAKAGLLATGEVRIYDEDPTGFLPGEGCGMVLLMRTADAIRADLPVYAEIRGWGTASAGQQRRASAGAGCLLLAMRRAYEAARIDPADVQFIEGRGSGVAKADEAELTALATLRAGASGRASLGAVTANIGNTRAAAGAAGLIKTVLVAANGVLPPSTGITAPHRLLREDDAHLRAHDLPEPWPDGARLAGVSAGGWEGPCVHLVLSSQARRPSAPGFLIGGPEVAIRPAPRRPVIARRGPEGPSAFFVHAADTSALATVLARIAKVAPWLSDAEFGDLACQLAVEAADQGCARVAIVARRQEQLGRLASEAIDMLPGLTGGLVSTRPGIFAADDPDGRVTFLFSGQAGEQAATPEQLDRALAVLTRLGELGVRPAAAVGHGVGELAGLVLAGCVSSAGARALSVLRASALAASPMSAPGILSAAIDEFAAFEFSSPTCRLVSGCTGSEIRTADAIPGLLTAELLNARSAPLPGLRLAEGVRAGAVGASLLVQIPRDREMSRAIGQLGGGTSAAGRRRPVAMVSIDGDPACGASMASAAAALFAAGALTRPELAYAGTAARPIDIWRDQVFISHPCQSPVPPRPQPGRRPARQPADLAAALRPRREPADSPDPCPPPAAASGPGERPVPGVAAWHRCYVEATAVPAEPVPAPADGPWRVHTGGGGPFCLDELDLFRHDPAAGRTLAVLGRLHEAGTVEAALRAAQDAISTGGLVAVSPDPGLTGLWATLHAEHPETGITSVRAPLSPAGLRTASQFAAEPGRYRELAVGADGVMRELAMTPARLDRGSGFPLGTDDVVLISRGAGATGVALAEVLACSGAAIAVVGRDHPRRDDAVIGTLEQLRLAGAAVGYEIVNPASAAALSAAVGRIERRFGPITAVAHAVGAMPAGPIAGLAPGDLQDHVIAATRLLEQLVAAARPPSGDQSRSEPRLRLVMTFGSLIGRYGLAREGLTALAAAALADQGERLAAACPGCRAIHADWPAWSGADLGERFDLARRMSRAGIEPLPVAEGARLLIRLLAAQDVPSRSAMHGRLGRQAPRPVALGASGGDRTEPPAAGRFIERIIVHYPGVELITEATIRPERDRRLTEDTIDGARLLPPTIAVEAMVQVATALTGRPMRPAAEVSQAAPLILPGSRSRTVIRICTLAGGDDVTAILRCEETGFAVDHFRATFRACPGGEERAAAWPAHADHGETAAASEVQVADITRPIPIAVGSGIGDQAEIGPGSYASLAGSR